MGQVFPEPVDERKGQEQLEKQQKHKEPQTAEHRPHQTLLSLFQKPQAGAALPVLIANLRFVIHVLLCSSARYT